MLHIKLVKIKLTEHEHWVRHGMKKAKHEN